MHAYIYESHSVKFAFIGRENIFFLSVSSTYVSFSFSPPPKFFPKHVFFFPIFIGGEKFFLNLCCSKRELLLFIGGVASILYRAGFICFLDSIFSLDFCCVCFLFTLYLSFLCQYVTKRGRNRWNVGILFVLFRGSEIVIERGRK